MAVNRRSQLNPDFFTNTRADFPMQEMKVYQNHKIEGQISSKINFVKGQIQDSDLRHVNH